MNRISPLLAALLFFLSVVFAQESKVNPFVIPVKNEDFIKNPKLLDRIIGSPHGYFRFINVQFSQHICEAYTETYYDAPIFNLHGDAHIEQYAVTDLGRGLTDFDDSSTGPAILDLMRMSVSLNLACRELGWENISDSVFSRFITGYRKSLQNPKLVFEEPEIVSEIRSDFTYDSLKYFQWIDSIMDPVPEKELIDLEAASSSYKKAILLENPELPEDYFNIVSCGYLRIGIGSALDKKYLLRCKGLTDNPLDDIVLELKEVRDISAISCLKSTQKNDPFRILVGQSRIAYQPFQHLGYFEFDGITYWVHSWVHNFKEVTIQKSFRNPNDLKEVAFDIGVQLGLGHPKQIAAPMDFQLRQAQLRWLNLYDLKIKNGAEILAEYVTQAWRQFEQKIKQ